MNGDATREATATARARYDRGECSFAVLVQALERVVDAARENANPAADELDRIWGELEIINATNEDGRFPDSDADDVRTLLAEFTRISSGS